MGSAAEFYEEVIKTPAFKDAMRTLLRAGSWVQRSVFDGMGHSPVAMDHALSDLVMLGLVNFQQAAGYRLAQPPLLREVAKRLEESGGAREVLARLNGAEVEVGVAMRDRHGDVVALGVRMPVPDGLAPADAAQWATDAVCGSFVREVGHG